VFYLALGVWCVTTAACFAEHPIDSEPVLRIDLPKERQELPEDPDLVAAVQQYYWRIAAGEAAITQLHAYINAKVLDPRTRDDTDEKWWKALLDNDPYAAAYAVSRLDTRYVVWGVGRWPDSLKTLVPEYRMTLMRCAIESSLALEAHIAAEWGEVNSFEPPSLAPPNGLPFGSHPSMIEDKAVREEYAARLRDHDLQQQHTYAVRESENILGQLYVVASDGFKFLYEGGGDAEYEQLARLIHRQGWSHAELVQKIITQHEHLQILLENQIP
jgi:hypothetical protein